MHSRLYSVLATLTVAALAFAQDKLAISGSTTVKPILERIAEPFKAEHAGVTIVVGGGGSSAGIKAVATGQVVVGSASRDLKDKEKAEWPELVATPIGRDGIAVITHAKNPVTALTTEQLRSIYLGTVANWQQLGGGDQPIEVVTIEGTHGTFDGFVEFLKLEGRFEGEGKERRARFQVKDGQPGVACTVVPDHADAIAAAMTRPNVIAFTPMPRAHKAKSAGKIGVLSVDGVEPTAANVLGATYPIRRTLNLVTKGQPSGVAKAFVDYCTGPRGQKVVEALEFLPNPVGQATPAK